MQMMTKYDTVEKQYFHLVLKQSFFEKHFLIRWLIKFTVMLIGMVTIGWSMIPIEKMISTKEFSLKAIIYIVTRKTSKGTIHIIIDFAIAAVKNPGISFSVRSICLYIYK